MRGLTGKRVLVTGGTSGIGAATAERFRDEGSLVWILGRTAAASVPRSLVADVSDPASIDHAFDRLDAEAGGIDVVINNAGVSVRHDLADLPVDEWRRVLDVNLTGAVLVAQHAARRMRSQGSGVILNMGSTNGIVGYRGYSHYNASKAALIELTKTWALELAPSIRVNAVCPGYILTPMQEAEYTPAMMRDLEAKIPLRRQGTPAEVAALFAFLASDDATFITGQSYVIDGGETAGGLASR
jgi:meso-butanediol dehydrogenase / (S,S)-butanediol dehydrogenase / diacetyl reductase